MLTQYQERCPFFRGHLRVAMTQKSAVELDNGCSWNITKYLGFLDLSNLEDTRSRAVQV